MFDDNGGDYFSADTGDRNVGPANGHILITRSLLSGVGEPHYIPTIRVGGIGLGDETAEVAQSFTMRHCGVFVPGSKIEMLDVPYIDISKCNTPRIKSIAEALGVDTSKEEPQIAAPGHWGPLSEGYQLGVE
jgi:hypothetical protein